MPPSLACKYCKNCAIPLKHLCPNRFSFSGVGSRRMQLMRQRHFGLSHQKYKLGKTSRTQRVTYPKIFFQRLRYFDANEGINPIMVDFIYKNFMISLHNLHVPKMKLRSRVFRDILKNTKIANITDTLMINTNLNSIFLGSFIGSKRVCSERGRKERCS